MSPVQLSFAFYHTDLFKDGIFIPTITSFIIDSYKLLSPDIGHQISQNPSPPPAASIIIVNVMWLISLALNIASTIFATLALIPQWTRRCPQLPQVPRDHMHSRSYLFLSAVSVFLFLAGLVSILFHYQQDSRHHCSDCLDCSWTLRGGLFGAPSFALTCVDRSSVRWSRWGGGAIHSIAICTVTIFVYWRLQFLLDVFDLSV